MQTSTIFEVQKFDIYFYGHSTYGLLKALFHSPLFSRPPVQLEYLGPWSLWTRPLFKLSSLVQVDAIVVNWSRQERDTVSQTSSHPS